MQQAPRGSDFGEILEGALALPSADQARLCLVLQRLAAAPPTAPPIANVALPIPGVPAPATALVEPVIDDEWLRAVQQETGWDQLQLLEDALAQVSTEEEVRLLRSARERLLQAQPALAVRAAVVDLATRHPAGMLLGCVGLCVALAGLGRVVVTAMF